MKQLALKPADVAVALRLATKPGEGFVPLATAVGVSLGEAHNAVGRLRRARLLSPSARSVLRSALLEFLAHGVPYAFPPELGAETRGVPTAHSAPPLAEEFRSGDSLVWPSAEWRLRGQALTPLYRGAPSLPARAPDLYELLALVDAVRVGRARERTRALAILRNRLAHEPSS
jgi:hypothetical protein